ncbi:hypothetical protein M514_00202 [Trichuris suis]|uniref:Uncharacterized protein n=1 Tax=Trichuris suis TaxID=68888 RepID=A0A085NUD3_9BILA|nr:hypothetical protein M513_00202 [Trichuris suis]KFD73079.1 hypothetical protein M514_00202 [Trichuris suis]
MKVVYTSPVVGCPRIKCFDVETSSFKVVSQLALYRVLFTRRSMIFSLPLFTQYVLSLLAVVLPTADPSDKYDDSGDAALFKHNLYCYDCDNEVQGDICITMNGTLPTTVCDRSWKCKLIEFSGWEVPLQAGSHYYLLQK